MPTPTARCPSSGATATPRRSRTASASSCAASAPATTESTRWSATGWPTRKRDLQSVDGLGLGWNGWSLGVWALGTCPLGRPGLPVRGIDLRYPLLVFELRRLSSWNIYYLPCTKTNVLSILLRQKEIFSPLHSSTPSSTPIQPNRPSTRHRLVILTRCVGRYQTAVIEPSYERGNARECANKTCCCLQVHCNVGSTFVSIMQVSYLTGRCGQSSQSSTFYSPIIEKTNRKRMPGAPLCSLQSFP